MQATQRQFLSFAAIGAAAFLVDAGVLYFGLHALGLGFYAGRLLSWTSAATFTWYLNRRLTFRTAARERPWRQWGRFLIANSVGGLVNYGVYAALVATVPWVREWPVAGVAAGSLAGLGVNFIASRRLVFSR